MLCFCEFRTSLYALVVKKTLMNKLCTACLDCEVILCESNLRLSRVAILRHKVAGIAGQHYVIYLTFSTFRHIYRFADVGKMIRDQFSGIFSRFFCLFYDRLKVAPLDISHYRSEFAGAPTLHAFIFDSYGLKTVEQFLYFDCFHALNKKTPGAVI